MSSDEICLLMQQLGLPALRIVPGTMEVIASNDLFADLMASMAMRDMRLWFLEVVLPCMNQDQKAEWSAAAARFEPARALVQLTLMDGREAEFEMRSAPMIGQTAAGPSTVCVFVTSLSVSASQKFESGIAQGQAMERSRIRKELHRNVSQKLLGAAFGCKLLAGKVGVIDKGFGETASDLAELLNVAVVDLQNLTRREQDY
jgi:signal transduction histidine kinase